MKRNTLSSIVVIGIAAVTLGATNLLALRVEGGHVSPVRGTQPPRSCVITIGSINSAALPLTLDLRRSGNQPAPGYQGSRGNEEAFNQIPGSPGPLLTVPATRSLVNVATVRVNGACGTLRRYRFLLRNVAGVEKELTYPSPTAYTPETILPLGDVHRVF